MSTTVLTYMPGQTVTIVQQVLNLDGYRVDGYVYTGVSGPNGEPKIARVVAPDLSELPSFPATMAKLDTGLYAVSFTLPSTISAIGLYIVDIYWYHPDTHQLQQDMIFIQCALNGVG